MARSDESFPDLDPSFRPVHLLQAGQRVLLPVASLVEDVRPEILIRLNGVGREHGPILPLSRMVKILSDEGTRLGGPMRRLFAGLLGGPGEGHADAEEPGLDRRGAGTAERPL